MVRSVAVLAFAALSLAANVGEGITGVWVLDRSFNQIRGGIASQQFTMQVEATALDRFRVINTWLDERGRHIELKNYVAESSLPAIDQIHPPTGGWNTTTVLHDQLTGALEEWTITPDGRLTINPPLTTRSTSLQESLVFHRSERRPIFDR